MSNQLRANSQNGRPCIIYHNGISAPLATSMLLLAIENANAVQIIRSLLYSFDDLYFLLNTAKQNPGIVFANWPPESICLSKLSALH